MCTAPTGGSYSDPVRLDVPAERWTELSHTNRQDYLDQMDQQICQSGIVIIAGALTHDHCDELVRLIQWEIDHPAHIERIMHQRRMKTTGYKIYNLQSRHQIFMDLITFPVTMEFFRRYLGTDMVLHSSEGAVLPHGSGENFGWHYDGYDRIPGYFLSMNSIYYLCDADEHNGATQYIPGTHIKDMTLEQVEQATPNTLSVRKGDLVLFNPYIWHAGSLNTSSADRPVIINYYQRSYIRQEFDYYRQMSPSQLQRLTEDQRTLLRINRPVPIDHRELYFFRPELDDMNPL